MCSPPHVCCSGSAGYNYVVCATPDGLASVPIASVAIASEPTGYEEVTRVYLGDTPEVQKQARHSVTPRERAECDGAGLPRSFSRCSPRGRCSGRCPGRRRTRRRSGTGGSRTR